MTFESFKEVKLRMSAGLGKTRQQVRVSKPATLVESKRSHKQHIPKHYYPKIYFVMYKFI